MPLVSVVMPVYNPGNYLLPAVASIINQSIEDWELICVDDGCQDRSPQILDWFASIDPRIRVIHQENQGIVAALNRGCEASRSDLIMRMDNDDLSMPLRIETQVKYMQSNPGCVVCGTGILEMDSESDPLSVAHLPPEHKHIRDNLLTRRTGHFHPTTMFRKQAFESVGGYRQEFEWIEDHDLWLRMASVGDLTNLDQVLLCYRQHSESICWQRSSLQRQLMNRLLEQTYRHLDRPVPDGLIRSEDTQRSMAGPGKWARNAAKGGYVGSAIKHLGRLNRSNASWGYKLRMNLETCTRIALGSLGKSSSSTISIPTFQDWEEKWFANLKLIDCDAHRSAA